MSLLALSPLVLATLLAQAAPPTPPPPATWPPPSSDAPPAPPPNWPQNWPQPGAASPPPPATLPVPPSWQQPPTDAAPPPPPGNLPIPPSWSSPPGTPLPPPLTSQPPAVVQASPTTPRPLGRAGFFQRGVNVDLLELGALQVFSAGGSASGIVLGIGAELDLGPHAAARIPLRIGVAGSETTDSSGATTASSAFAEVVIAPGWLYRFRERPDQHWVPYAGGALPAGAFDFGRQLLGLQPSPPGISQSFVRIGVAPEALAGILYCPTSLFALRFEVNYTFFLIAKTEAHALTETVTARFSF